MLNFFKGSKDKSQKTTAKLYVADNFSVHDFIAPLRTYFDSVSMTDVTITKVHNGFTAAYEKTTDEKKGVLVVSRLLFLQTKNTVYVTAETLEINPETNEEHKEAANFDMQAQGFFKYLQEYVLKLQDDNLYALHNAETISFVTSVDATTKNYLFHQLQAQEYVLAVLRISELTVHNETEHYPKNAVWYFVITSVRTLLVGKLSESDMETLDISNEKITITSKTGKDKIETDSVTFYTEFLNDHLYTELLPLAETPEHRLQVFGDILVQKYHKKEEHLVLASRVYQLQSTFHNKILNELKSEFILHLKKLKITEEHHEAIVALFTKYILSNEDFGKHLVNVVTDWQLSFKEQMKLLMLLQPFQKKETATRTIHYHKHLFQLVGAKEKKDEVVFEFNLNYAKHLTNAKRFEEAIVLYDTIYEALPDDSITDLLPTDTTNLLEGEGGQQLKITILEAILDIQKELQIDTSQTVHKLAELQPLKNERITALEKHPNYAYKAKLIQEILQAKTLETSAVKHNNSYAQLEKEYVFEQVVPTCFKNAKGFFDSLNSFIAALNPPDYKAVISFSDRLHTHNYPEITERISAICHALQMDVPECYIGRGAYAASVIGVEGKPSFLLIGIEFLEPEYPHYLEPNALIFLIAIELAHMYFEHSKITSTDVWRGAADKGFTVVSMLLTVLPFVGNIGKIFGNVASVERYGKIINRVEQVANVADKGQGIIEVSEKLNLNPFSRQKSQANDSQNLLITSRLMEIVADKVALLFCNDLKAAIKALLIGKSSFQHDYDMISEHGIEAFLARTNTEGEFVRQALIIRIKSLFSFYLSDTYETLKKQLYKVD